jgi:hypothetical protein
MNAQKQPNDRDTWVENPAWDTATHRFYTGGQKPIHSGPSPPDREIWDKAVNEAKKEQRPELTDDRPAIRRALREMRQRHTVRVKSILP